MNNTIGNIDLLRILPPTLKQDKDMSAAAQVIAEQLQKTSYFIRQNIIYARIDELSEAALDVLAYDLHVDWYDYAYPIEVKRQTIKDSVKVHRRLGTKYAVETALGAVFPQSQVKEWFQYGGKPYFFRVAIPVPESGITWEQQRQIIKKLFFYKNLRSHLESIDYQAESTGTVRIGACTTADTTLEIWPELVSSIEVIGKANIASLSVAQQTMEIFPELVTWVEMTGKSGISNMSVTHQTVEIYPELVTQMEITGEGGTNNVIAVEQTMDIYPETGKGDLM